jgi:hypothetical protein
LYRSTLSALLSRCIRLKHISSIKLDLLSKVESVRCILAVSIIVFL